METNFEIEAKLKLYSTTPAATLFDPSPSVSNSSNAKLPKVEPPKFDGNPLEFQVFWDLYNAVAHENSKLDDILKFKGSCSCVCLQSKQWTY